MNFFKKTAQKHRNHRQGYNRFLNHYWKKQLRNFLIINIGSALYGAIVALFVVPRITTGQLTVNGYKVYGFLAIVNSLLTIVPLILLKTNKYSDEKKASITEAYSVIAGIMYITWGIITVNNSLREGDPINMIIFLITLSVLCAFFYYPLYEYIILIVYGGIALGVVLVQYPLSAISIPTLFNSLVFEMFLLILGFSRYRASQESYEKNTALEETNDNLRKLNVQQTRFSAALNHELRTPLNGIIGTLQVMNEDENLNDIQKSIIEQCGKSAEDMLSIVNDMLDFAKIEAGEMSTVTGAFDLHDTIKSIVLNFGSLAERKGLDFKINIPDGTVCGLHGDETRIKQIINNIVSNSVKYTSQGSITVSVKVNNKVLNIVVSDTGQGMSEENIKYLFEPYKRFNEETNRKIQGTGLGMSIVDRLMRNMNGHIDVKSELGKGSTFTIDIPIGISDSTNIWKSETDDAVFSLGLKQSQSISTVNPLVLSANDTEGNVLKGMRVLCVDDMEVNLKVIELLLKDTGVKLTQTSNSHKALELAQTNRYDVMLIDHQMPELDGVELLDRIRSTDNPNRKTAAIVLTGNLKTDSGIVYSELGFDGYLVKPVLKRDLMAELTEVSKEIKK